MGQTPQDFFSYSREDSEFALRLATDLKASGATVWLDQLDISPGQRWDSAVEEALVNCARMLVVLSPAAVASHNVMDEVSYASETRKTVIPVLHRDCTIPFRLRRVQYVDFRGDYGTAILRLLKTLGVDRTVVSELPNAHRQPQGRPRLSNQVTCWNPMPSGSAKKMRPLKLLEKPIRSAKHSTTLTRLAM
jgi:hypothetical protein